LIEEVLAGVLVSVINATGQRLGTALGATLRERRGAEDVAVARWFETYRLTRSLPVLPSLSDSQARALAETLEGYEAQAVLHELLATRLTDAPDADETRLHSLWELTFSMIAPDIAHLADTLFAYYDGEICELTARLEGRQPALLQQIRDEAFNVRIIATLNAIERHTAALAVAPDRRAEADFLARYRRHVVDYHGKLDPPDFERRRRVPIANLYVPPSIVQIVDADPFLSRCY
jgi:hypothetical protein